MSAAEYKAASILLIEDDDIDAKGVERALRKLKISNPLLRAKDGIEGLEMLANKTLEKPFIVILDLNLPRMSGLEFLERLRKNQLWDDTVVFILTTSKDDQDKYAAYKQQVAGYVVKEKLDQGFDDLIALLDHYWRIVELPLK